MNGIDFGKELKKLRANAGIPSKTLSLKVGKAVTYVSQLENGKIKNPDFDTCFKLLKELGIDTNRIEGILDPFGIMSPEREKAELQLNIKLMEQEEEKWRLGWYEKKFNDLHRKYEVFTNTIEEFIRFDMSRAEKVVGNLVTLTKDEEDFDFFCSLFENNLSSLDSKSKANLLRLVTVYVQNKNTEKFVSDLDDIGEEGK